MSSKLSSLILSKKRNIIYRSRQFLSRASNDDNNVPAISNMKTAGIIVIGDEILKGEVHDTNSHHAMKIFHKLGIKVEKVSIIGDVKNEISQEVKLFSKTYDYVLTTGGIGPTHDDVTFGAIANAFNVKLHPNPELVKICSRFYKTDDVNAPGMKIAFIPETAKLTFGKEAARGDNYPNVSIKNVYIFPGIPQLFKKSLDRLANDLFQSKSKFYCHKIYLNITEQFVVQALDKLVSKYPQVTFGSYPNLNNDKYKVKLTIESTSKTMTQKAASELLQSFAKHEIVETELTHSKLN